MIRRLSLVLALALLAPSAFAQQKPAVPAAAPPAWEQLSTADREALVAPLRDRWNNASPEKRQRMLEHAREWRTMTPEQRKAAREGMKHWSHMDPEKRDEVRALYERTRGMDPEQRKALRKQWPTMTPEQRKAWIDAHPPTTAPAKQD